MAALLGLFSSSWTVLVPLILGAAGVIFGLFKHQQAATATAKMQTAQATADTLVDQAKSANASAQASQAALTAVTSAAQDRVATEAAIPTAPGAAQKALDDEGFTK